MVALDFKKCLTFCLTESFAHSTELVKRTKNKRGHEKSLFSPKTLSEWSQICTKHVGMIINFLEKIYFEFS